MPGPERAPRLVLRFALITAVCLGVAAAAILLTTRHLHTAQAERSAAQQARLLTHSVLAPELTAGDFSAPVTGTRRNELDQLFRQRVFASRAAVAVTLVRADGLVTYSTDHARIGQLHVADARIGEALDDTVTSQIVREPEGSDGASAKLLRSYVPVALGAERRVALVDQDYESIAAAAEKAFLPVAGILEVVLLLLYVLLVPILARVSRRMQRQTERIRHQAYHDELTGLPNRFLFRTAVERALARGAAAAVLVVDLDRFKDVNDTLGHGAGDELLREVAARLRDALEDGTMLARLGGDEFAVLAAGAGDTEALALGEQIHAVLSKPFELNGVPLGCGASVGLALAPEDGDDAESVLRRAEVAMYAAKEKLSGVARYDAELDPNDLSRLALMNELRRAIEQDELVVHYQPKLDLWGGTIIGAEALVRWQHPERGLLAPSEFVPLAQYTGLMRPLTSAVLVKVVRQAAAWRAQGLELPLAVNLTMLDLLDEGLPNDIAELLEREGAKPEDLTVEITESAMMSEPERVRRVLEELSKLGLALAIDDFGTGYSSLAYLKSLPVDTLKIDRSFVIGLADSNSDRSIVRATIELAHSLGLRVVAEGVETEEAKHELRVLGCDIAQGYLIGRPVPPEEFAELLERHVGEDLPALPAAASVYH